MGDEKDSWKVKTLDEILQEKKRRKEQEEKAEIKRMKNSDDRDSKRDSLEEGELRDHRMEITIRNSPYRREDSMEDRGEEDDSLAIKPPQQMSRKEKTHHRKDEKRKEKRRHRSHSAEGKHARVKEKEREHERRKRHREEQDKARREWERQKRREMAREHSRRERDRLEQLERERERKIREQQKEQREQKERERRAEERRKEREARREVSAHHRTVREEYGDKVKMRPWSRSPLRQQRDKLEQGESRKPGGEFCFPSQKIVPPEAVKEEKPEERDPLSDLQDISESERKTSSAESSSVPDYSWAESGSGSEEEEEESSSEGSEEEGEEEEEEEETGSNSEEVSEQSAEEVSEEEMSEEEERENGNHVPVVPESRFDRDSAGSEVEEEEVGEGSPHSNAMTEGEYIPDSPASSPIELKQELPKYLPALQGCRSVEEFQCLNRIEEGTYGVVYRAKDKKTDEIVALKRLKMEKEKEGFPITSLREINTILKAQHLNIVTVREIVVGSNMDKIYIVMNYVEHDLKSLMETMKQPFLPGEVKTLMIQLLRGVKHLHDNWILHRDLKTSNLLLSHSGILKVGDFGLAREYGSPLKPYTPVVVTLWYRAPELLLGAKEYSTAIDMWSVGCIFGELLTQKPLFPGKSEIDQINKVFKDLGTPSEKIWPGYNELPAVKKMTFTEYPYNNLRKRFGALLSDQGFDLMNKWVPNSRGSLAYPAGDGLQPAGESGVQLGMGYSQLGVWGTAGNGLQPAGECGVQLGMGYSQLGDDDLKDTGFHLTTTNQGASAAGPGFSLKF
ncbi:CD11B kinase, partial [Copsychus sechellarum]|nr:CD11B kinase [Copsychus sechellarum]